MALVFFDLPASILLEGSTIYFPLHSTQNAFRTVLCRWLPFSDLREMMEFKIVHAFFRTTFALPTSFDFALYMQETSDSYILSLVDVEASTWLILLVACFVNLGRVKLWQVRVAFPVIPRLDLLW